MRRSRGYTRRYSRRIKTVKYSNETANVCGDFEIAQDEETGIVTYQFETPIIPSADIQGTRKCKNFELSLTGGPWVNNGDATDIPVFWALVYVPQGTSPSSLNLGELSAPVSLYEPNQNVIMSGVWPANLNSNYKVKSRLARNLNSGDAIAFIAKPAGTMRLGAKKGIAVSLNYAIAY